MVRLAPPSLPLKHRELGGPPLVYLWCHEQKMTAKHGADSTHTVMDARTVPFGVIKVPEDKMAEFLERYVQSIPKQLYVIERIAEKEAPRRMYLDLDLHFKGDLTNVDDRQLFDETVTMIYNIVHDYSTDANELYVLSAGMTLESQPSTSSRLGLHLIWPKFIVTQGVALAVRRGVLLKIAHFKRLGFTDNATIGGHQVDAPWCNIIDEAVLTGQTLRMPFSRKAKIAPTMCKCFCDARTLPVACVCHRGVMDLGRPYLPFVRVFDGQITDIAHDAPLGVLQKTCIRVPKETPLSPTDISPGDFIDLMPEQALQSRQAAKAASKVVEDLNVRTLVTQYCMCYWGKYFVPDRPVVVKQRGRQFLVPLHNTRCCNARNCQHTSSPSFLMIQSDGLVYHSCMSSKVAKRRFQNCGKTQQDRCCHKLGRPLIDTLFPKKPRTTTVHRPKRARVAEPVGGVDGGADGSGDIVGDVVPDDLL